MKANAKYLCLMVIFLAISTNVAKGEAYKIQYDQHETDLKKLWSNVLFGTNNGNISVHYNLPETSYEYDAFKFNSSQAIKAMVKDENHLFVMKEDDGIYACPFDFKNPAAYQCTGKAEKLHIEVPKVSGMSVINNTLRFVTYHGHIGYCNLDNYKCFNSEESNFTYTGISYDSELNEIYVSLKPGYLHRCPAAEGQITFNCMKVFDRNVYPSNGLSAVHVAYGSVWLGTRRGEVFKCSLAERKDMLDCHEFVQIEFKMFEKPTIFSISSNNNEQLFVHAKEGEFNRIVQCNPKNAETCSAFKLPEQVEAYLNV